MFHTYCKACVKHHLNNTGATVPVSDITLGTQGFQDDAEDDAIPDDGAIEINSDDEYCG
ncbi:hypothetical protein C8R45DRAFT_1208653 [Mycena sanguinolenta]|nr:hypothetical protein C8R45DRAFT_1213024 [Mycena sanguinolenta]KAJ6506584.1 hypothetical protein C8R45DRAFT_1208653 [Mycena sanguinolenta]